MYSYEIHRLEGKGLERHFEFLRFVKIEIFDSAYLFDNLGGCEINDSNIKTISQKNWPCLVSL